MRQFHVAINGNDSNSGAFNSPFATLERARDEIRRVRQSDLSFDGAEVLIHGGIHERTRSFELTGADSGSAAAPVCYRSAPGEMARIVGGQIVKGWGPVTDASVRTRLAAAVDRILCADLRREGIVEMGAICPRGSGRPYVPAGLELFFNSQPLHLACWPKRDWLQITRVIDSGSRPRYGDDTDRGAVFEYEGDRPACWAPNADIWVQGMFGTVWADDMIRVAELDSSRRAIRLAGSHLYGVVLREKTGAHFRFVNVLEELTEPGEWYLDRDTGVAYLIPPVAAAEPEIIASMLADPLVVMEDVAHVEWSDLTFEASRGMGVYIEGGAGNRVSDCVFRNLGTVAVAMGQGADGPDYPSTEFDGIPVSRRLGNIAAHLYRNPAWNRNAGHDHAVLHCKIHDMGEGGVILSGGDRRTLVPGSNRVSHCHIFRTNRLTKTYRPAILIDGVGNIASHNRIEDLPHAAIIIEGNDHCIECNRIANVVNDSEDGGAIYACRDIAMHGTVIRYNVISGARGGVLGFRSGIYLDDQVGGILVYGNVLMNNSIAAVISGRHIKVLNNILIGNDKPIGLDGRQPCDHHPAVLKAIGSDTAVWIDRYPEVARAPGEYWGKPVGMEARNNVCFGGSPISFELGIDQSFLSLSGNIEWTGEPGLDFGADGTVRLRVDSEFARALPWVRELPFDRIGPDRFLKWE